MKVSRHLLGFCLLLIIILLAHVALWQSERLSMEAKWQITRINAIGWSILLLPAIGVHMWLKAKIGRK